jgi:peptidoglycan/LPS O-acetylase OafA/YrhL
MDALRASSMLLLVPVHAAILLKVNGNPGGWATAIYWSVHVFRLPLFFAMSGFFLALLLSRKGLEQTARNRTMRILIPLAVGLVTIVPLLIWAANSAGVSTSGDGAPETGGAFSLEPSFLWFLWYLLIVDAVAISSYLLVPVLLRRAGGAMRTAMERPLLGIGLLALPTALTLWGEPTWVQDPDATTFVPEVPALVYYALFFSLGATLYANRDVVGALADSAWRWACAAIGASIPAGILFGLHNTEQGSSPVVHGAALLTYSIATWTCLLALVGLATRYMRRPRPALRYIADSSYWIYLSHLPMMVLVIGVVGGAALGTAPSFVIVTVASLGFSFVTYTLFVRYTVIGRVLNGPRVRRRPSLARRLATSALPLIR